MKNYAQMEQSEDESVGSANADEVSEEEDSQQQTQTEDDDDEVIVIEGEVVVIEGSARVSERRVTNSGLASERIDGGNVERKRRREHEGEVLKLSDGDGIDGMSQGKEWNREEIDGLFCPICMEAWTNDGVHQVWYETDSFS